MVDSLPSNATFVHYNDAGSFSFETTPFDVYEREYIANVTVMRLNAPPFPSPVAVSMQAFDGTAKTGSHFDVSNQTVYNLDERLLRVKPLRYPPANLIRGKLSFYWSSERHSELSPPRKECK